jgi:hypothetical protein
MESSSRKGFLGLELGTLTPLFVAIFNAVWGLKATAILARIEPEPSSAD